MCFYSKSIPFSLVLDPFQPSSRRRRWGRGLDTKRLDFLWFFVVERWCAYIYILWNWWRRKTYLGSHHKASLHFVLEPACLQVSANTAQREWCRPGQIERVVWLWLGILLSHSQNKKTKQQTKGSKNRKQTQTKNTNATQLTGCSQQFSLQSLYALSQLDLSYIWLALAGHWSAWKTLLGGKCWQLRCLQIQREIFETTSTGGPMLGHPF